MPQHVPAEPFPFPLVGELDTSTTCLLMLDFQQDWTARGGFVHAKDDPSAPYAGDVMHAASEVLRACRVKSVRVVHARRGFRSDLADASPLHQALHVKRHGRAIGAPGPFGRVFVRDEKGWEIDPVLHPVANELVLDRSAVSAFSGTDLDQILRGWGVNKILLCGSCLDGPVMSTLRQAHDLGYQLLLLADCCASSEALKQRASALVSFARAEAGNFGCVADSAALLGALGVGHNAREVIKPRGDADELSTRGSRSPLPPDILTAPTLLLKHLPTRYQLKRPVTPAIVPTHRPASRNDLPPRPATCDPQAGRQRDNDFAADE